MFSNSPQALVLNEHHVFSDNEIGAHMVTTINGLLHPLKVFSHGFPNNEETQEGSAVLVSICTES